MHRTKRNSVACHITSDAVVLLDSGLKLFDIIVDLCSKLYYEVLLKSRELYCAAIEAGSYV